MTDSKETPDPVWNLTTREFTGDSIEVQHYADGFNIEVDEPWAGDTRSGFGQTCHARLTVEDAVSLANWILARAALTNKENTDD